jgi:DNA-binding SARP family transcriptional activator/TolB-like protein
MLQLGLLGGVSLEGGRSALSGRAAQRHRIALLALLAVAHPRALSRDKLVGYLWPESDARHARNLLSQAVHALRRALGTDAILSTGDELRLNPDVITSDVWQFQEALAGADAERAVALYAGPLLDGFFLPDSAEFERWIDFERDRLRELFLQALRSRVEAADMAGDPAGKVAWLRRLAAEEPYNSGVTLLLMNALQAAGDRAGAIRQAEAHAALLRQEFDAEPTPEVVELTEQIRAGTGASEAPTAVATDPASLAERPGRPRLRAGSEHWESPERSRGAPGGSGLVDGRVGESGPVRPPLDGAEAGQRPAGHSRRAGALAAIVLFLALAGLVSLAARGRSAPTEIRRVAVLPLANLTGDPEQDYFAAGLHDALISELAQVGALTVYSRQSVLRYQGSDLPLSAIARELGVDALVEGSVFTSGDSVRIIVQLVRAQPEEHVWAGSRHGPLSHALAFQGEVARDIARSIRARVAPDLDERLTRGRTVEPETQQAYLRGSYHLEQASYGQRMTEPDRLEELQTAIRYLEAAVALDPAWATAHGKLALAYHWLASGYQGRFQDEFYPKSKAAALRALELDETESQAHASLGFVLYSYEWDWVGAERSMRRALELDPNSHHSMHGLFLQAAGRHDEAIRHFHLAEERTPLAEVLKHQIAGAYACAGRHDEAIAQARELNARVTRSGRQGIVGDSIWLLDFVARQLSSMGRHDEAIATSEQLGRLDAEAGEFALAMAYARAGRRDEARVLADRIEARVVQAGGLYNPAHLHAALGDTERALVMVESADFARAGLAGIRCTLFYQLLQDEPRMQAIIRPVGFSAG